VPSPKLKEAMSQIQSICREYDIAGHIVLCDGKGESEFALYLNPTWSVAFLEGSGRIRFRSKLEDFGGDRDRQERNTAMTVNTIVHLRDQMAIGYKSFHTLIEQLRKYMEITEMSGGPVIPHKGPFVVKRDETDT
jgi:hypothetical protein